MIKDDTSKKRKLPTIDHGIDIIGDEMIKLTVDPPYHFGWKLKFNSAIF